MKLAFVVGGFCLLFAVWLACLKHPLLTFLFLSCAVCFIALGIAYKGSNPSILMKLPQGNFKPMAYLLFWPLIVLNEILLFLWRRKLKGPPYVRVGDAVLWGARLREADHDLRQRESIVSVLDLTAEVNETTFFRSHTDYLNLPILPGDAPSMEQLKKGLDFMDGHDTEGKIYVHCLTGDDRSALFVAAYMVLTGLAQNVDDAISQVHDSREDVEFSKEQEEALRLFFEENNR